MRGCYLFSPAFEMFPKAVCHLKGQTTIRGFLNRSVSLHLHAAATFLHKRVYIL
jgi:hypothetical protein